MQMRVKLDCDKIAEIMARKGLRTKDVAGAAKMNPSGMSSLLKRGDCLPLTAGRLAKALGVDVREIMRHDGA